MVVLWKIVHKKDCYKFKVGQDTASQAVSESPSPTTENGGHQAEGVKFGGLSRLLVIHYSTATERCVRSSWNGAFVEFLFLRGHSQKKGMRGKRKR